MYMYLPFHSFSIAEYIENKNTTIFVSEKLEIFHCKCVRTWLLYTQFLSTNTVAQGYDHYFD